MAYTQYNRKCYVFHNLRSVSIFVSLFKQDSGGKGDQVRENVWKLLEIGLILGYFFHSGLYDKVRYSSENCPASRTYLSRCCPVADPDPQIRWGVGGGGRSHPDPEITGASL